jgi:hypothetical protein
MSVIRGMLRAWLRVVALVVSLTACVTSTSWAAPPVFSQGPNFATYSVGRIRCRRQAAMASTTWQITAGTLPLGYRASIGNLVSVERSDAHQVDAPAHPTRW